MGTLTVPTEPRTMATFGELKEDEVFRYDFSILIKLKNPVFSECGKIRYNAFNLTHKDHNVLGYDTVVQRCSAVLDWCLDDKKER